MTLPWWWWLKNREIPSDWVFQWFPFDDSLLYFASNWSHTDNISLHAYYSAFQFVCTFLAWEKWMNSSQSIKFKIVFHFRRVDRYISHYSEWWESEESRSLYGKELRESLSYRISGLLNHPICRATSCSNLACMEWFQCLVHGSTFFLGFALSLRSERGTACFYSEMCPFDRKI